MEENLNEKLDALQRSITSYKSANTKYKAQVKELEEKLYNLIKEYDNEKEVMSKNMEELRAMYNDEVARGKSLALEVHNLNVVVTRQGNTLNDIRKMPWYKKMFLKV